MEHSDPKDISKLLIESAACLSIPIDVESAEKFSLYLQELRRWNQSINLTAIEDDREIVVKHFVDSLACTKWLGIQDGASILDIGAGAGFPGMPIKLLFPDVTMDFIEPNEKKSAFLRYLVGRLRLEKVRVISAKLENIGLRESQPQRYDYIVVRAFKIQPYANIIRGLLNANGVLVLFRATRVEPDFQLQGLALIREVEYELPSGFGHRVLSIFSLSSQP